MMETLQEIIRWYQAYYADGFYLLFAIFTYLYLFVHCRELRGKFLLPMGLLMFCALNPILYKYVFSRIIYWRLFWMFPTAILIALAVVKLVRHSEGKLVKLLVLGAFCGLIVIKGMNVYQHGGFTKVQNFEKVPKAVQEICDVMLELEENPRCIMPQALFCDVRQYSGEIEMMYGRNVNGYLTGWNESSWWTWWQIEGENPNYVDVMESAKAGKYEFLIVYDEHPMDKGLQAYFQYEEIGYYSGYILYYHSYDN